MRRRKSLLLFALSAAAFLFVALAAVDGGGSGRVPAGAPIAGIALGIAALAGAVLGRHDRSGDRRATVEAWARLVLVAGSLVISFLAAEIMLRRHLERSQGFDTLEQLRAFEAGADIEIHSEYPLVKLVRLSANKKLIYELRPSLNTTYGRPVITNATGMRETRDFDLVAPPGTVRIVGIGDSGMFGFGLEQDQDYLSVLERRLAARHGGTAYEVLNFGVPGYNSQQEMEVLRARALPYRPNIVIVGWCVNDASLPDFVYPRREFNEWNVSYAYPFLFDRARFGALIHPDVQHYSDMATDLIDPAAFAGVGWDGVRRAYADLAALSRAHDFRVIVFGPLSPEVAQICQDLSLPVYDTLREIPPGTVSAEYAVHDMHPGPAGHELLGEHLERALDRQGWLPGTPGAPPMQVIPAGPPSCDTSSPAVEIPDATFAACLRARVLPLRPQDGLPLDCPITVERAGRVTVLDCADAGIADVRGLERFSNVDYINLGGNRLETLDLAPFANASAVFLGANRLTTLTGLAGLGRLQTLWLGHNLLGSIDASGLTALEDLRLDDNRLLDFTGARDLGRLHTLRLARNPGLDCRLPDLPRSLVEASGCGRDDAPGG
jgi:lysophospholipase L1-like esterase